MFGGLPFNYPTGESKPDGDEEALSVTSSQMDLWAEVCELRTKLRQAEVALAATIGGVALEGKPILVAYGALSRDSLQELAKLWSAKVANGAVLALPADYKLEELNDDDLAACGLKRVSRGPTTERDHYESMLQGL